MNSYILFIYLVVGTINPAFGGAVGELSADALAEALNGGRVEGYSQAALESELGGAEARRLVEKCEGDDRLRQFLVFFPEHITDNTLKDEVIGVILSEPRVWLADEKSNPMDKAPWMQSNHFANHGLREAFFLGENAPEIAGIRDSLLKRSTRLQISNLFRRVTRLAPDQRTQDSSEMKAAVEDLRQIPAGREPSNLAPRASAHSTSPSVASPERGEATHEGKRGIVWIPVVSAVLLAVAGFFAFRRKSAKA
ncbi:hypothetical protein [Haloferula sp. BvORR071]|uniref:hypothetical protein n=1 Tax=Haloferula sp. BvORR071 TaxID=1396141 RepID=UPI0005509F04|nr:hypothetical protein [Haloferula sp. BvORR071]